MPDTTPLPSPSHAPTALDTSPPPFQSGGNETPAASGTGEVGGDAKEEVPEVPTPMEEPPPKQNEKAMKKRLYRIMKPRANGTKKVPQGIIDEYNDSFSRWKVFQLFEKTGYNPDRGLKQTTC